MGVGEGEVRSEGGSCGVDSVKEPLMVAQKVCLGDTQLEIEDIEVLPLNTSHIPLAENAGTERPMNVL